jgi:hypothetical protein
MSHLLLALALAGADPVPGDETLYLNSYFDTDGFTSNEELPQLNIEEFLRDLPGMAGPSGTFPASILPEGKRFEVLSGRFGSVSFLRPSTAPGDKNMISCRGQTIRVRTKKTFNLLLAVGAAQPPALPDGELASPSRPVAHRAGWVRLRFEDGSEASAPIGFSDWAGDAVYGEEPALEATNAGMEMAFPDAIGGGDRRRKSAIIRDLNFAMALGSGSSRLWLQRTPIPANKVLRSITLPDLPEAKIVAMTLVRRDGIRVPAIARRAPPEPALVAVFDELGFPSLTSHGGVEPEAVRAELERAGVEASLIGLDDLADATVFSAGRFPVLILPYGGALPVDAEANLRSFRKAGGAVVSWGVPFSTPVERTPYGAWLARDVAWDGNAVSSWGIPNYAGSATTRFWPSAELESWGFKDLPWGDYSLRDDFGADRPFLAIPTGGIPSGPRVGALLNVGSWPFALAGVIDSTGAAGGEKALTMFFPSGRIWLGDSAPLPRLEIALVCRAAAFALREKGLLDAERWKAIARPLEPADVTPSFPPLPAVSEKPFAELAGGPEVSGPVRWVVVSESTREEKVLFASVQGLLHRDKAPLLYLAESEAEKGWLETLVEKKYLESIQRILPQDVIALAPHRRAVVVDPDVYGSLNLATMIASVEGLLVAYPGLVDRHKLEVAADLRGTFASYAEMLRFAIEHLKPRLNPNVLAAVPPGPDSWHLRDYLIAQRLFTFWVPGLEDASPAASAREASDLVTDLILGAPVLAPVLGDPFSEALVARSGKRPIRLSAVRNLSLSSRLRARSWAATRPIPPRDLDAAKIYVAVLSLPQNADQKHSCCYFRKSFDLPADSRWDLLVLETLIDDGCVVYVNGKEQYRFGIRPGEVAFGDWANQALSTPDEIWRRHALPRDALEPGNNTIAVEVHQSGPGSSDLSFDLRLSGYRRSERRGAGR